MARFFLAAALVASAVAAQTQLAAPAAAAPAQPANTVDLVGGWNVTWNIRTNSTTSPSEDIQIQNSAASSTPNFNGYDLGLIFQRASGSGEIALDTATNPLSNSIVPGWAGAVGIGSGLDTNGAGVEALLDNEASDDVDYSVPNSAASLVTVNFMPGSTTPTVGSVFDVYSDTSFSDYVDSLGNSTPYANNAAGNYLLGTITVVPEPGSLVLLGVAAAGYLIHCARRKG